MQQTTGLCPHCGFANELTWVICDACGERLPWAPPRKPKVEPKDMTEEQLAAIFAPGNQRELPFWLTPPGRAVIGFLVLAIIWFLTMR